MHFHAAFKFIILDIDGHNLCIWRITNRDSHRDWFTCYVVEVVWNLWVGWIDCSANFKFTVNATNFNVRFIESFTYKSSWNVVSVYSVAESKFSTSDVTSRCTSWGTEWDHLGWYIAVRNEGCWQHFFGQSEETRRIGIMGLFSHKINVTKVKGIWPDS